MVLMVQTDMDQVQMIEDILATHQTEVGGAADGVNTEDMVVAMADTVDTEEDIIRLIDMVDMVEVTVVTAVMVVMDAEVMVDTEQTKVEMTMLMARQMTGQQEIQNLVDRSCKYNTGILSIRTFCFCLFFCVLPIYDTYYYDYALLINSIIALIHNQKPKHTFQRLPIFDPVPKHIDL